MRALSHFSYVAATVARKAGRATVLLTTANLFSTRQIYPPGGARFFPFMRRAS